MSSIVTGIGVITLYSRISFKLQRTQKCRNNLYFFEVQTLTLIFICYFLSEANNEHCLFFYFFPAVVASLSLMTFFVVVLCVLLLMLFCHSKRLKYINLFLSFVHLAHGPFYRVAKFCLNLFIQT